MENIDRFPWIAVSALAAVGVFGAAVCLRLPKNWEQDEIAVLPALRLTRAKSPSKELLAEKLAAYDPSPLFMPSPMSSNEPTLPEEARAGFTGPFAPLNPTLTKKGLIQFPAPVAVPKTPVDGLRLTERTDAAMALAREDTDTTPLPERLGQVEAVSVASGRVALVLELPLPDDHPEGDWQPMELMGAVTKAGLAGALVITSSSGSDEIDGYFRSHLKKNVRFGERLPEGFYAFRVGP